MGGGGLPVLAADGAHQRHNGLAQPGLTQSHAFAYGAHGEAPGPGPVQGAGHGQQAVAVGVGLDDRHDGTGFAQTREVAPQSGEINVAAGRRKGAAAHEMLRNRQLCEGGGPSGPGEAARLGKTSGTMYH